MATPEQMELAKRQALENMKKQSELSMQGFATPGVATLGLTSDATNVQSAPQAGQLIDAQKDVSDQYASIKTDAPESSMKNAMLSGIGKLGESMGKTPEIQKNSMAALDIGQENDVMKAKRQALMNMLGGQNG